MSYDLIIRGGTVVDGTRLPRLRADVGIRSGKVAKIGRIGPGKAARELDATGLIVAAGFLDRGYLRAGAPADIVVYDLEKLRITPEGGHDVVYDYPANEWRRVQRAEGYRWILVNGEVSFEDGKATGATLKAFCNGWAGASGWC